VHLKQAGGSLILEHGVICVIYFINLIINILFNRLQHNITLKNIQLFAQKMKHRKATNKNNISMLQYTVHYEIYMKVPT